MSQGCAIFRNLAKCTTRNVLLWYTNMATLAAGNQWKHLEFTLPILNAFFSMLN